MSVFSIASGAASDLIRAVPRRAGLGPKQLAWCRANIPLFAEMEMRALERQRDIEQARLDLGRILH